MFGYITIHKDELKFKEYDVYHSYYCGLCHTLKERYGCMSRLSLNFDMTFLALLLTGLYEPETKKEMSRCVMHPIHRQAKCYNQYVDYAADMTIVLSYLKCEDDWQDEKKVSKQLYKQTLKKAYQSVRQLYPHKIEVIEKELSSIHRLEKEKTTQIDEIAGCFGKVMAEICVYQDDEWKNDLYELGFYLGKFIYLMDAYDDVEKDIKKGNYNPFIEKFSQDDFEIETRNILEMMIARASTAFECLPIIENEEILRNILYSGVWSRYELRRKKRMGEIK